MGLTPRTREPECPAHLLPVRGPFGEQADAPVAARLPAVDARAVHWFPH